MTLKTFDFVGHKQLQDSYFMHKAIRLAKFAERMGEIPVGAILVKYKGLDSKILSVGINLSSSNHDPTSHAEIIAIRRYSYKKNNYRFNKSNKNSNRSCYYKDNVKEKEIVLYVTLEPCLMCLGAIANARINRVLFDTSDTNSRVRIDKKIKHLNSFFVKSFFPKNIKIGMIDYHQKYKNSNRVYQKLLADFFKRKRL